jgi:hypothetical protein
LSVSIITEPIPNGFVYRVYVNGIPRSVWGHPELAADAADRYSNSKKGN